MPDLIAQTANPMEGWGALISAIASIGFAAWMAVYLIKTHIPRESERYAKTIESVASDHKQSIEIVVAEFRGELREARAFHREERESDRASREADTNRIVAAIGDMRQKQEPEQARISGIGHV